MVLLLTTTTEEQDYDEAGIHRSTSRPYRVGNAADGQDREDWTVPTMAGAACCRHLDRLVSDLHMAGVLSNDELDNFHNTI